MTEVVGIADLNQMTVVKRWQIVDMPRKYSIAEHSYRVAMIAMKVAEKLKYGPDIQNQCAVYALQHDLDEVFTGDLPTPIKKYTKNLDKLDNYLEIKLQRIFSAYIHKETLPSLVVQIVKLADYADTLFELYEALSRGYDVHSIEGAVRESFDEYVEYLDTEGPTEFRGKMCIEEIPFDQSEQDVRSFILDMVTKPVTRIF